MSSILVLVALLALLIQLGFWCIFRKAFGLYMAGSSLENFPGISIIICAKNAKDSLESNLAFFLDQEYPKFELIVVDDHSTDRSLELLEKYSKTKLGLRYFCNAKAHSGKKEALILGIQNAQYEWIALSDADCRPCSKLWLNRMVEGVNSQTDIVIGYAPYEHAAGFLNKLIRLETCLNSITLFSAALCSKAYTATGRNLLYRKSIFDRKLIDRSFVGGDDDLLVNARATSNNVSICLESESFIYSKAKRTLKDYFLQKWRHYGVSVKYSLASKMALFFLNGSLIGFYVLSGLLLYKEEELWFIILMFFYWMVRWPVFCHLCKRLKEEDLCLIFPVLELLYVCHLMVHIPFLFIKKKTW